MSYPSDLSDTQWTLLESVLTAARASARGRPVGIGMRHVMNAIFYVVKTGCQWRQLPREFGPWMTIYAHFRRLHQRGTWDRGCMLCVGKPRPRRAQSRTEREFAIGQDHGKRGQRGYDAGKKTNGRKRHIAADTQGFLLAEDIA